MKIRYIYIEIRVYFIVMFVIACKTISTGLYNLMGKMVLSVSPLKKKEPNGIQETNRLLNIKYVAIVNQRDIT